MVKITFIDTAGTARTVEGEVGSTVMETAIKNGVPVQGNFDTYPVVRYKDAPKTEVYISPTPGKRWGGVGEPGATMIQPAVTNAIFAATGKRLRKLPVDPEELKRA